MRVGGRRNIVTFYFLQYLDREDAQLNRQLCILMRLPHVLRKEFPNSENVDPENLECQHVAVKCCWRTGVGRQNQVTEACKNQEM